MKNIRKYMMAAACMTAAAALVACTEAVKRDTEEEIPVSYTHLTLPTICSV